MVGTETFTDLDYADDIALLSKMLEVLLLALDVLKEEASPLALEVNWQKTKIQTTIDSATLPPSVLVAGKSVDIVVIVCLPRLRSSFHRQLRI